MIVKNNELIEVFPEEINKGFIKIPSGITKINKSAFSNCYNLQSVELPEGLKEIDEFAFKNCNFLASINFPNSLVTIGKSAFSNCQSLSKVVFPNNLEYIGYDAFSGCKLLDFDAFPKNLKYIGSNAFKDCENLSQINLPSTLSTLGEYSFSNCNSAKSLKIPQNDELNSIPFSAFQDCRSLIEIEIPSNIIQIEQNAFFNCSNLKKIIFNDGLKKICFSSFSKCESLENIDCPKSLLSIEKNAFSDCFSLKTVNFNDNLTQIGNVAFANCKSLTSVSIPPLITNLSNNIFENCESIESVIFKGPIESIGFSSFLNCHNLKNINFPPTIRLIMDNSFKNCNKIEKLKFPNSLKNIGSNVFSGCSSLSDVELPESLFFLGNNAFSDCTSLHSIRLPDNLKDLDNSIFSNCINLKNVILPKSLLSIGNYAFENCESLDGVKIPESVQSIGEGCFKNCTSLTEINIPNSVIRLDKGAFYSCQNLEKVRLPENLEKIEDNLFSGTKIKNLKIPNNVAEIGNSAFSFCYNLENIELPDTITNIGSHTFENCSSLKEIHLPQMLSEISDYMFSDCHSLNHINIPPMVKNIGQFSFNNCEKIYEIKFPENLLSIKKFALNGISKNFSHLNFPKNLKSIDIQEMLEPTNIPTVHFPSSLKNMSGLKTNSKYKYFIKNENGFSISVNNQENAIPINDIKVNLPFLSLVWDYKKTLFKEQNNKNVAKFYNEFLSTLSNETILKFMQNHNFTFFKQLPLSEQNNIDQSLFKGLYNLGVFNSPIEFNGKKIDYAQKVVGLIIQNIDKVSLDDIYNSLSQMKSVGFNKEFTDFYIENFESLYKIESEKAGFIARCYNDFEEVQKTNTNNRGSQRQLKATIEKFEDYFRINKFEGVTPKTEAISDVVGRYFSEQKVFDRAVKIMQEKENRRIRDNILKKPLKESDIFSNINDYAKEINDFRVSILNDLTETATNEFSFEWLAKNDPQNLILGKLCSCCSHLCGAGYGIMYASIVHPNIQNLVIRNNEGQIVAKSTLYINPNERYGVLNNVEISERISQSEINIIYKKFILAINEFAKEYNKENPTTSLRQINVGMCNNDLQYHLKNYNTPSDKILSPIDYSEYGFGDLNYGGDSLTSQYIVWQNEQQKKDKKIDFERVL